MKPNVVANVMRLALVMLAFGFAGSACAQEPGADIWQRFTMAWRDDATWYDGKAEEAIYDATRVIYGKERTYRARIYTNKELADPQTKTKSANDKGRPVFKHHLREDAPTENYTYHYSTMCYVGSEDLKSLKIDMGSQEDCGASFKQFVNHAGTVNWEQFSYFPNEGRRQGSYQPPGNFVYHDALSLVLRGYPFDKPLEPLQVQMLPDQTSNKFSPATPMPATIAYVGEKTLELPIGKVQAHGLKVSWVQPPPPGPDAVRADGQWREETFWFAADGAPPLLHVMVQYDGTGVQYKLREQKRWAYWEH